MTTLTLIDSIHLDAVWAIVAPILARAIRANHGEESLDQVRMQIAEGRKYLFIWHEGERPITVVVVGMQQMPNCRIAHVAYLAGESTEAGWSSLKEACRKLGASKIQAFCGKPQARLFRRFGMADAYTVMRADL